MAKKDRKKPLQGEYPFEDKIPKVPPFKTDQCLPEFKADLMDLEGPWNWSIDPKQLKELFLKIFDSQKLTWQSLRERGSHLVKTKNLCAEAQKRLMELQKGPLEDLDLEEIYSLRLTGKKRVWGIKDGNIFRLLWWDPEHEVCPSHKKHT